MFSLKTLKNKEEKSFVDFIKNFADFQDLIYFYKNKKLLNKNFLNFDYS